MRVVLDTNIWISGLLLPNSKAGHILKLWKEEKISLITSNIILKEIERVLTYPKIKKRIKWTEEEIQTYIVLLSFFTEVVDVTVISVPLEKDPTDSWILETLLKSKADYLVTGDKVLLDLANKFPILCLEEFSQKIEVPLLHYHPEEA